MSETIVALDELRALGLGETRRLRGLDDPRADDGWVDDDSAGPIFESLISVTSLAPLAESREIPRRAGRVRAEDLVALTVVVGAQIAWLSALVLVAVAMLR